MGERGPLQVLGTPQSGWGPVQSSYRELTHNLRIHMGPRVRLFKGEGLKGFFVPYPGRTPWGTPKVYKTHLPTHKDPMVWEFGAIPFPY